MATGRAARSLGYGFGSQKSPELERIIAKCLESDRALRYQHAADLRTEPELAARIGLGDGRRPSGDRPDALASSSLPPAVAAAVLVGAYVFAPRAATLTDTDTIVLGEFTNTTGDAVFDETLRQGLAAQLQQSPFLSVISEERIRRTLPLMNQPADARLTPDIARVVCVRTGGAAVLQGSIAALGSQYVLGLRATNCETGDILADEQAQASRKEEVLSTLSQMTTRFRTRVGESLATVERYSTPLASDDAVARRIAGLQRRNEGRPCRLGSTCPAAVSTCGRDRSGFCAGPCEPSGSATAVWESRRSRDRACSGPTSCAIAPATSSASTSTPALLRLHGEPGTGATNVGNVGRRATRAIRRHTH